MKNKRTFLTALAAFLLMTMVVIVWILYSTFSQKTSIENPPNPLDYFAFYAQKLNKQPQNILNFIDSLETLPYKQNLQGPLGALLSGRASQKEKLLLLQKLLERASIPTRWKIPSRVFEFQSNHNWQSWPPHPSPPSP
ncbi:MAG: hypothetical protein D6805_07260, partial [Planctomycetota bacterium]